MSIEENKALIRRFVETRNTHDVEAFVAFFPAERRDQVRRAFNGTSEAFPDVRITIEDMIGEGDKIVLRWSFRGTHLGLYRDMPATGNKVNYTGIDIYTIAGEQIVSMVREQDNQVVLKQLGETGS